jgi:uncharacterized protein (TIGR02757 family)
MNESDLKEFLDFKVEQYENSAFISSDPIQIPHLFSRKEDIEIMGFLLATIAWGNRKSIITNGNKLVEIMDNEPFEFIKNYSNTEDLDFFFRILRSIYENGGLENSFSATKELEGLKGRIHNFRTVFLATEHQSRSEKHISNPLANSACKRLVMFLRWMIRDSKKGVDFGIWKSISPSELYIPLDVHTGNIARKLGLLTRTQNDWTTNEELISKLREFDSKDPAKYDFALFGLGAFEQF